MSQVFYATELEGRAVEVMAGWDRAMSEIFITVAELDQTGAWVDGALPLVHLSSPLESRPVEVPHAISLVAEIHVRLNRFEIRLPPEMIGEVAAHIVLNTGNLQVRYDDAGKREVLAGQLLEDTDSHPGAEEIAHCIGCGCDDFHACQDATTGRACHWLRVDRAARRGVCSTCAKIVSEWDAAISIESIP